MPETESRQGLIVVCSDSSDRDKLTKLLITHFPERQFRFCEPSRARIHRQGYRLVLVFEGLWGMTGSEFVKTALSISPDMRFALLVKPDEYDIVRTRFKNLRQRPACIIDPFADTKRFIDFIVQNIR